MFADEARFGRMNRPRPCWAPRGIRPGVASQLIREYIHLYGAVCPQHGACVYLIMPTSNTACFQSFLNVLSRRFARQDILLVPIPAEVARRSGMMPPTDSEMISPTVPR
jgi:putative transposase